MKGVNTRRKTKWAAVVSFKMDYTNATHGNQEQLRKKLEAYLKDFDPSVRSVAINR